MRFRTATLYVLFLFGILGFVCCDSTKNRITEERLELLVTTPYSNVRKGAPHVTISDLRLLSLLVEDETCVNNLTQITFSNVVFDLKTWERIQFLVNVTHLGFYDCEMVDNIIPTLLKMNVTEIALDTSPISQVNYDTLKANGIEVVL